MKNPKSLLFIYRYKYKYNTSTQFGIDKEQYKWLLDLKSHFKIGLINFSRFMVQMAHRKSCLKYKWYKWIVVLSTNGTNNWE